MMEMTKWVHDESEEGNRKALEEAAARVTPEAYEAWLNDPKNKKVIEAIEKLKASKE